MSIFSRKPASQPSASSPEAPEGGGLSVETRPCVLLAGDDFAGLSATTELAGRNVILATTTQDAMAMLRGRPFDGLIASFRDAKEGLGLLNAGAALHPGMACGLRAEAAAVRMLTVPWLVLPRTPSAEVMDDAVRTLFAAAQWVRNPAYPTLMGHIKKFPALPSLYMQISSALQDENSHIEGIADLIALEPAVSARLLQVVNSPFFGLQSRVTSIRDAANFFGLNRLRALVLATSLFGQCDSSKCRSFSVIAFESHSIHIGTWASKITVGETGDKQLGEMAFTAGLLHQFGSLLFAANLPEGYDQILRLAHERHLSAARVERDTYGMTHAEIAGAIFATWGIPFPIVNAVGWYAEPSKSDDAAFTPLTAVHLAASIDSFARNNTHDVDQAYLDRLRFQPRLDYWSRTLSGKPWGT